MEDYFAFWFGWSINGQNGQNGQSGQRGTIR